MQLNMIYAHLLLKPMNVKIIINNMFLSFILEPVKHDYKILFPASYTFFINFIMMKNSGTISPRVFGLEFRYKNVQLEYFWFLNSIYDKKC